MTDVKVIDEYGAREDAYNMGYSRFEDMDEVEDFDFAPFTDSAEWANTILPKLRAMAGYDDAGYGTWQQENRVVLVTEPDDEPADGTLVSGHLFYDDLADDYRRGAYDAAENRERDPPVPTQMQSEKGAA